MALDFDLPRELTSRPQPLITLAGLDSKHNADHRIIADAFTLNRRSDRLPINFQVRPTDHIYPIASPARQSYEFFHARGILKKHWLHKHLQLVPSVCVLFFDLDWDHDTWNERVQECLSKIQCIRASLTGRNSRVALVLLQSKTRSPLGEDMLASERAAQLCSTCDLSSKHLFILPYIDQHLIFGYVQRLESALFELAQLYYQGETKRVKSRKEFLNKGTHLLLFIRHQFKCAFFSELRQDMTAALQHYVAAYGYLTEVQATVANSLELRTIGGYLNYKICRLCFRGGAPRDALNQFRKHIDQFKTISYYQELAFEHRAWLAKQFSIFGDLFDDAVRSHGLGPVMAQHPGFYFKQASDYTIERRKLAGKECASAASVFEGDIDVSKLVYVGQRPWRVGYKEGQTCSPEDQQAGIYEIQAMEGRTNYSWFIVQALSSAITHFNKHRSPRMRETLRLQLGKEYVLSRDYAKALSVLGHSMAEFRVSQWWVFLIQNLKLALRCAYATAQVEDYMTLAIELIGSQYNTTFEERSRIQANMQRIISNEVPEPEPDCTNAEITKANALWTRGIGKNWREDRIVTQPSIHVPDPQCSEFSIEASQLAAFVQCKTQFLSSSFYTDEAIGLKIFFRLSAPQPITFSRIQVTFAEDAYPPVSTVAEATSDATVGGAIRLENGQVFEHTFRFLPPKDLLHTAEVNSKIEISSVQLSLGSAETCCAILRWSAAGSDMTLSALASTNHQLVDMWRTAGRGESRYDLWENIPVCPWAQLQSRSGNLDLAFSHSPPALVKEFYPITLTIRNNEKHTISNLTVTVAFREHAMVESSHLSLDTPQSADSYTGSLTITKADLPAGNEVSHTIFLHCQQVCQHTLVAAASYGMLIPSAVGEGEQSLLLQNEASADVLSVHPFDASVKLMSMKMESVDAVHKGEEFILAAEVRCSSPWPITIKNTALQLSQPFMFSDGDEKPQSQLCNVHLEGNNVATECFAVVVSSSATQKGSIPLGQFTLEWCRAVSSDGSDPQSASVPIQTVLSLPTTALVDVPFVITASLPSHGEVRKVLPLSYNLTNQTGQVQEVELEIEPSESFMYAGDRKIHVRVAAKDQHAVSYQLYPNVPGYLSVPKLRIKWLRQDVDERQLRRSLPTHVFVQPVGYNVPAASA